MLGSPEYKNWDTETIIRHAGDLGAKLANQARQMLVALRAAQEKDVVVFPPEALEKFRPGGEYDVKLVDALSQMRDVVTYITTSAGLEITEEELHRRLLELDHNAE
jgi:hypothetical protein